MISVNTLNIDALLTELGEIIGLKDLKLNESGICSLAFDKKMDITIEPSPDGRHVYLHASLCMVPKSVEERERLFGTLLTANLLGRLTNGAAFCLDPEYDDILLSKTLDLGSINISDFAEALRDFANAMEAWTDRLHEGTLTAPDDESSSSLSTDRIDHRWMV